jgi:serine O-acetyltransferase
MAMPECPIESRASSLALNMCSDQKAVGDPAFKIGAIVAELLETVLTKDPVWHHIRAEAEVVARAEPLLTSVVHAGIIHQASLEDALSFRLAQKLASPEVGELVVREIADEAYKASFELGTAARADVLAVYERDPACHRFIQPLLFFKGFLALQSYRIAHWLWELDRNDISYFFQMRTSEVFGVDIHPRANLGTGIMIDHAHSIVIGETAVVGNNVSMLHSVTLGGSGKESGDRHPKVRDGVLIGAGAAILGNIEIGKCSRVAAGSVVLQPVPACSTVAGVPARIVGTAGCEQPSAMMDQLLQREP